MKKRLTPKERKGISYRNNNIKAKETELQLFRNEYKMFITMLLESNGLDPNKKFDVGDDGELVEVKEEKK